MCLPYTCQITSILVKLALLPNEFSFCGCSDVCGGAQLQAGPGLPYESRFRSPHRCGPGLGTFYRNMQNGSMGRLIFRWGIIVNDALSFQSTLRTVGGMCNAFLFLVRTMQRAFPEVRRGALPSLFWSFFVFRVPGSMTSYM